MQNQSKTNNPIDILRIKVVSIDGKELSSAVPQKIRKMISSGAAVIKRDPSGAVYAQMKREVGMTIPH